MHPHTRRLATGTVRGVLLRKGPLKATQGLDVREGLTIIIKLKPK